MSMTMAPSFTISAVISLTMPGGREGLSGMEIVSAHCLTAGHNDDVCLQTVDLELFWRCVAVGLQDCSVTSGITVQQCVQGKPCNNTAVIIICHLQRVQ